MKINKIYINAFGGIKDFTLDLSDGFQIIYGENEAGKTTICEFIKSMFYGTGKRTAGQNISTREKYAPWDGTPAGGRIYFEHSNRDFFIEREFRKSDSTDKVTITDIATGKSESCPSDIGKTLFGISVGAFEKSVFIGNMPEITADAESSSELNQRLSNAAFTGEDDISYAKILKRIDDARFKLISKSGRTGSCVSDRAELENLTNKLYESENQSVRKQEILKAVKITDEKIKSVDLKLSAASEILSRAKDIENSQKLKEYIELKEKLDDITNKLTLSDGTVADEMFLKKFEFGFSKLDNIKEKIAEGEAELAVLKKAAMRLDTSSPEQINESLLKSQEDLKNLEGEEANKTLECEALNAEIESLNEQIRIMENKKKAVNPVLLIIGIVGFICAGAVYFSTGGVVVSAIIAAAAAILTVLSFVLRPADVSAKNKQAALLSKTQADLKTKKAEILMIQSQKNNLSSQIQSLNLSLNFEIGQQQKVKDLENKLEEKKSAYNEEKHKVMRFFGLPEDTDIESLKETTADLSKKAEQQKQIKLRLLYLDRDLGGISYDEAREKVAAVNSPDDIDIEAQKQAAEKLMAEKSELREAKARLETELKTAFRNIPDPQDLRREIEVYRERVSAKQEFFDAATVAAEVLEQSLIKARQSFGGLLEDETLDIFKGITGGAYDLITVSDRFDMAAEKSNVFGTHGLEYSSRGTKDQAYLALRLAIGKLITGKEPLPVILDDSLSQYDDKRFSLALKFLKSYAEKSQLCLFTCHNAVCEEAEKEEIRVVRI